jgi:uncharacterized protein (TIGR00725 family)
MRSRLKIVGVMGSGTERHEAFAIPLGVLLARLEVHLLTGGGLGVMEAVSQGFLSAEKRAGVCIGVLPGQVEEEGCGAPLGYPNLHIEVPIRTHLPGRGEEGDPLHSRNSVNIASADAVVVLPGGSGTASEARLALQFRKPVLGFGGGGEAEGILQAESLEEVEHFLKAVLGLPR